MAQSSGNFRLSKILTLRIRPSAKPSWENEVYLMHENKKLIILCVGDNLKLTYSKHTDPRFPGPIIVQL